MILCYVKGRKWTWNPVYTEYDSEYVDNFYKFTEPGTGRRYQLTDITGPGGAAKGNPQYELMGVTRYWRYGRETMAQLVDEGRIVQTNPGTVPRYKRYLDEMPGVPIQDIWNDIRPVAPNAKDKMGYPTQKPVSLLERIIAASSNEGDWVMDPFCGCGTAIHAAQNLNRRWIGVDICVNACKVIEQRIKGHFDSLWSEIEFVGLPKTVDDAQFLASNDPFRFERWAASLVDGMEANRKQRGDGGIDGWGRLPIKKGQFIDVVAQVKGGHTNPGHVQAFNGARQQAGADLGIFTCFGERVTGGMRNAAANAGLFMETPVLQIYTVEDYFEGRRPKLPVAV